MPVSFQILRTIQVSYPLQGSFALESSSGCSENIRAPLPSPLVSRAALVPQIVLLVSLSKYRKSRNAVPNNHVARSALRFGNEALAYRHHALRHFSKRSRAYRVQQSETRRAPQDQ